MAFGEFCLSHDCATCLSSHGTQEWPTMWSLSPVLAALPDTGQLQDRQLAVRSCCTASVRAHRSSTSGTTIRLRSNSSASQVD